MAATVDDVHALVAVFAERDYGAEPASGVRAICACCSEGSVAADPNQGEQWVSLAAPPDEIPGLLDGWRAAAPDRRSWAQPTGA
ncbi:hypothetical protein GKC29_27570 [Micromonospora sp. WMMC415]|uniref:hypothetical protein n=1 Tax=Micromonospora sp. WMMC415 TaxID=2675222 RepID=UPI0012B4A8C0|nr:hypothetical protein [Micromonospora sp. WMMC415]QGN50208.1 hypothetical protein GKC29_27570 [Micromonospora sp. WMMC415]